MQLTSTQRSIVARAVALLRPHELPRFERALAGQLAGIVKPSDDEVLNAVHTALDHLGVALGRGVLEPQRRRARGR